MVDLSERENGVWERERERGDHANTESRKRSLCNPAMTDKTKNIAE